MLGVGALVLLVLLVWLFVAVGGRRRHAADAEHGALAQDAGLDGCTHSSLMPGP